MKENLHIKFVESSISKIDMDTGYGVLKLPKASSFSVVVEEYEKETKAFDDEFDKNVELSKRDGMRDQKQVGLVKSCWKTGRLMKQKD